MRYVPNVLTISRIVLTPVLLVLLMSDTLIGQIWALGLFIVAAASDYLDGKLARVFKVHSRLGQFLDPFADKVLVLGMFVALAFLIPHAVPWWAVVLIALRDVMVTGLRTWTESRGRTLRTLPIAKTKTTVQLVYLIAALVLLVAAKLPGSLGRSASWILQSSIPFYVLLGVVLFTLGTGALYFVRHEYTPPVKLNG